MAQSFCGQQLCVARPLLDKTDAVAVRQVPVGRVVGDQQRGVTGVRRHGPTRILRREADSIMDARRHPQPSPPAQVEGISKGVELTLQPTHRSEKDQPLRGQPAKSEGEHGGHGAEGVSDHPSRRTEDRGDGTERMGKLDGMAATRTRGTRVGAAARDGASNTTTR